MVSGMSVSRFIDAAAFAKPRIRYHESRVRQQSRTVRCEQRFRTTPAFLVPAAVRRPGWDTELDMRSRVIAVRPMSLCRHGVEEDMTLFTVRAWGSGTRYDNRYLCFTAWKKCSVGPDSPVVIINVD